MSLDEGRIADLNILSRQRQSANPAQRAQIDRAMYNIQHESSLQQSMRKELIKAARSGDPSKTKEIREYVAGNKKYQNE